MQLICLSCGLNPLGSITARHPTALLQWNQVQNNMNEEHRVEYYLTWGWMVKSLSQSSKWVKSVS